MSPEAVMRLVTALTGAVWLVIAFVSYARKKLGDLFSLFWFFLSLCIILGGALPGLSSWARHLNLTTYFTIFVIGNLLLIFFYIISRYVSTLLVKNQELAMQVSLLNYENNRLIRYVTEKEGKNILIPENEAEADRKEEKRNE